MNSITFMAKAMEYEFSRQVDLIENGGQVVQETLRYDEVTDTTSSMRGKEDAHDYRYFREPDLVTIHVTDEEVEALKRELPELPGPSSRVTPKSWKSRGRTHSSLQSTGTSPNTLNRQAKARKIRARPQISSLARYSAVWKTTARKRNFMFLFPLKI